MWNGVEALVSTVTLLHKCDNIDCNIDLTELGNNVARILKTKWCCNFVLTQRVTGIYRLVL